VESKVREILSTGEGKAMIGASVPCLEGEQKVTGAAQYLVDLELPGMLCGKILRSPVPHAKVVHVNPRQAESLPGVFCVVTREDFKDGRIHPYYGDVIRDQSIVAIDRVRYVGDPVAAVAAVDALTAEEALGLIKVEYEELPAVMDPVEAMQPGAVQLHDRIEAVAGVNPVQGTNICHQFDLQWGDVAKGFQQADYIFEDVFESSTVAHAALEPHGCIADCNGSKILVWTNTQHPFKIREAIAHLFDCPEENIRVIVPFVGGSFGGKSGGLKLEPIALALSWKSRRPVRVLASLEETFLIVTKHASKIRARTGVKKDGTITAREGDLLFDTGAYATGGPWVITRGAEAAVGLYKVKHIRLFGKCCYTNKPPAGAYRGYGQTQTVHAWECHTDRVARELGIDPLEFRLKNLVDEGDRSATGDRLTAVGIKDCLERVARDLSWEPHAGKLASRSVQGTKLRGKGLAVMVKGTVTPSAPTVMSEATLQIGVDGGVSVHTATVNMGQGSDTVLAQIAAECAGLPLSAVRVVHSDTGLVPWDWGTSASRSTYHMGVAIRDAWQKVCAELLEQAAVLLKIKVKELSVAECRVFVKTDPARGLTFEKIVQGFGEPISAKGSCITGGPVVTTEGELPSASTYWMWCAAGAEVEVDRLTGEVSVLHYATAADVGRAVNPQACEGQLEGSAVMALGQALLEEMVWENGQLVNAGLIDYPVPTMRIMPNFKVGLVERPHDRGAFGAKGLGTVGPVVTSAAVVNAVYDATGVLIPKIPLTPSRVLAALDLIN